MKKLLGLLITLTSISTYAGSFEKVCRDILSSLDRDIELIERCSHEQMLLEQEFQRRHITEISNGLASTLVNPLLDCTIKNQREREALTKY